MDAIATMAGQLQALPQEPPPVDENDSKAGRMRTELRDNGPQNAKRLAQVADLPSTGLVSALLKWDLQHGRVCLHEGIYTWNYPHEPPPDGPRQLRETLVWHEIADGDFPDADLTVIVRLRNNEEPVWLGYWDGEEWRDVDGQPVEVVRWADLPAGGEA